jgi:hypothetical protein
MEKLAVCLLERPTRPWSLWQIDEVFGDSLQLQMLDAGGSGDICDRPLHVELKLRSYRCNHPIGPAALINSPVLKVGATQGIRRSSRFPGGRTVRKYRWSVCLEWNGPRDYATRRGDKAVRHPRPGWTSPARLYISIPQVPLSRHLPRMGCAEDPG